MPKSRFDLALLSCLAFTLMLVHYRRITPCLSSCLPLINSVRQPSNSNGDDPALHTSSSVSGYVVAYTGNMDSKCHRTDLLGALESVAIGSQLRCRGYHQQIDCIVMSSYTGSGEILYGYQCRCDLRANFVQLNSIGKYLVSTSTRC